MKNPLVRTLQILAASTSVLAGPAGALAGESQEAARSLLRQAAADFVSMQKQFAAIDAVIILDEQTTIRDARLALLPDNIRTGGSQGPEVALERRWRSELSWDRGTGDAVVTTTRLSHKLNGSEQLDRARPVLFSCVDRETRSYYPVVQSGDATAETTRTRLAEDIYILTDPGRLGSISGQPLDRYLLELADGQITSVRDPKTEVIVSDNGTTISLLIRELGGEPSAQSVTALQFSHHPHGLALTEWKHDTARGNYSVRISYGAFQGPTGTVTYPELVEETAIGRNPDGGERSTTRRARVESASFHPDPRPATYYRDELAVRFGINAADTMQELVDAPTRSAVIEQVAPARE